MAGIAGGSENSLRRVTPPRRVVGRESRSELVTENVGPDNTKSRKENDLR
jgi:hypothetical protein